MVKIKRKPDQKKNTIKNNEYIWAKCQKLHIAFNYTVTKIYTVYKNHAIMKYIPQNAQKTAFKVYVFFYIFWKDKLLRSQPYFLISLWLKSKFIGSKLVFPMKNGIFSPNFPHFLTQNFTYPSK